LSKEEAVANRYVDDKGNPLETIEENAQFRRMPVYLELLVDQRYTQDILVHCANCPMPIDVLWVRINPEVAEAHAHASTGSTYGTTRTGAGLAIAKPPQYGIGANPIIGANDTRAVWGIGRGSSDIEFGPNAVTIEIFGCINIFAPPPKMPEEPKTDEEN
jgi:hypothetical protein